MTRSIQSTVLETTADRATDMTLSIRTFGPLQVSLDGQPVELPASRKTRALLAFLVLSEHPQRRDRLCALLWDSPPDSRSSLRWSLSKLRPLINAGGCARLLTDRERVQISPKAIAVDFHELRARARDEGASVAALSHAWELSNQPLIEDCELPNQPDFMAWLQHQRNECVRLRVQLSRRLALSPDVPAEDAEKWAERWMREAPGDLHAAQQVIIAKRRLGCEQLALAHAAEVRLAPSDFCESAARIEVASSASDTEGAGTTAPRQVVRFAQADDETALAWASAGAASNPPLVKAANWLTHIELDWDAPMWSPLFHDLARTFRFIRYDGRGCGLSHREVPGICFDTCVADLERVVDAAGLERFPLLGISEGAAVSIEYAARHPERVSHLILFGGYAAGWRHTATPEESLEREALMVLTAAGWDRDNPSYRGLLSRSFMPDATSEQLSWFDEFQRRTTSPKNAVRFLEAFSRIDVRDRLKEVKAPTLVMHSRGDVTIPLATGRELAGRIPNAEFAGLDSSNHMLLGTESASREFLQKVRRFLLPDASGDRTTLLSRTS